MEPSSKSFLSLKVVSGEIGKLSGQLISTIICLTFIRKTPKIGSARMLFVDRVNRDNFSFMAENEFCRNEGVITILNSDPIKISLTSGPC